MLRRVLTGLAAFAMLSTGTAFADIIFTLDTSNLGGGFTGPFATAVVHLVDPTDATVTFDSLDDGTYTYLMGDGGTAAVNVNAATWTLGATTGSNSFPVFSPGPYSDGGSGNEDGFGSFNQKIDSFDGFTSASTEIVVSLTNTSGTWADASSVLTGNASGHSVAIHAFACKDPCTTTEGAALTGFATNGGGGTVTGEVPEPGSIILLGSAMLLAGVKLRKRLVRS